ncbi:MAG: glutathione S-transferase, partial [Verrucomicrobiae bacterium]|nr:glutathione S-transferase [Verrucomicrobiae bacterium]
VAEGVLDGESLNAADFQIATSIRLACTLQDLKPFIVDRPIGKAAFRACPDYSGDVPPALPAEWLAPLRESASSAAA